MLASLHIHNLALIGDLTLEFHQGMLALTGETGAGKSIVADAVTLGLGGRADRELIRSGEEKGWVELVFDAPENDALAALMKRQGIEFDGRTAVLYREITRSGRNLCRICGAVQPLTVLREAGTLLMDVHGQHEQQFLMDADCQQQFLDACGDEAYQALLQETAAACGAFLDNHRRYAKLVKENEQKGARVALLQDSLEQLRQAALKPGEEEELQQFKAQSRSAALTAAQLEAALAAVSPDGEESAAGRLRAAAAALEPLKNVSAAMAELASRCASVSLDVQELCYDIAKAADQNADFDADSIERAEARLDLIRRLERRYGPTLADVLSEQERMEKELERLTLLDDEVESVGREHKRLLATYRSVARRLSAERKKLALQFEQRLMEQLADLGMEKLVFQVRFAEPEPGARPKMPRPCGDDELAFYISPNPGEPLKPLSRIVSGGELSRIMLAVKTLESQHSGVDSMVFDEIDTGISGRAAQAVAEKMALIGRTRQVIAVTHLPQLAAMADEQYLVSKEEDSGRTWTSARELTPQERVLEIARMIAGASGAESGAAEYAKSMLQQAAQTRAAMSATGSA